MIDKLIRFAQIEFCVNREKTGNNVKGIITPFCEKQ
jgi:hypothetical protein